FLLGCRENLRSSVNETSGRSLSYNFVEKRHRGWRPTIDNVPDDKRLIRRDLNELEIFFVRNHRQLEIFGERIFREHNTKPHVISHFSLLKWIEREQGLKLGNRS